jgi:hypothetical protein
MEQKVVVGGFLAKVKKLKREQVEGQAQERIRNCNENHITLSK